MTTGRPVIREIVTKAVCGRGSYKYQRSIDLEVPFEGKEIQVLGNFISNAALEGACVTDKIGHGTAVQVKGHYDVHVWYAYDQETKAAKTTVNFIEYIPIELYGGESLSNLQANAGIAQKPYCRKAYLKIVGGKTVIRVEVEQDLTAEVVGLTKMKVGIVPSSELSSEPLRGIELSAPLSETVSGFSHHCSCDLKCEEDVPEEFDDDYDNYCD